MIFSLLINDAVACRDYIALVTGKLLSIEQWENNIDRDNLECQKKNLYGAALFDTNLTWSGQELKPVFRGKIISTKRLSHVTK